MKAKGIASIGGGTAGELVALLLEQVPSAIALFDHDLCYVAANRRWARDFDLRGIDLTGRQLDERSPDIARHWRQHWQRALAGATLRQDLDRFEHADGTVDWLRWNLAPWHDGAGAVHGVLLVCEVLTDRLDEQLRSRILGEELALFLDIAHNFALCMLDDAGRITIWNSGAERLCGWAEEEVLGRNYDFVFDPADIGRGLPERQLELARENGVFRDRSWRVTKEGERFLADITLTRIEGDDLLPPGYGQVIRDVTQEDIQARSLEASTVLLRSILETVPDAMIVIDEHGIVLSFSKAAEQMFGYAQGEVVGRNVDMLMPSPDRELHDGYMRHYLQTGEARIIGRNRRVMGRRKDGSIFAHDLRVGEAIGGGQRVFTGFVRDLTEAEEAQARTQELQRELAHIARVSEMGTLATAIAHELNQPLMAIGNLVQASADLLTRDAAPATETIADALDQAGNEALRAGQIVKRLRRFLSRGELEKSIEAPASLVQDACDLATADAAQRGIDCALEIAPDLPDILVDRIQVQQVIVNLLRNAIEAVDDNGRVRLRADVDGSMLRVSVEDDGPGVPPDRIGRLFEPFATTKPGGMGLGLAICRTIIRAHGGRIWYEKGASGGARFLFTLPSLQEEAGHDG